MSWRFHGETPWVYQGFLAKTEVNSVNQKKVSENDFANVRLNVDLANLLSKSEDFMGTLSGSYPAFPIECPQ
jgi:hypothetical protein